MQNSRIDSVLNEVSRAIAKTNNKNRNSNLESSSYSNVRRKHNNRRTNVPISNDFVGERKQDELPDNLPIYINYWLAQSDPSYADHEENPNTFTTRRRERSLPNAAQYANKNNLSNVMSPEDLKRVLRECFPNFVAERTSSYGAAPHYVPSTGFIVT